ncbi:MAG: protein kinase [Mariniblastus sp.]
MSEISAEKLAQRIHDCGLLSTRDLEVALSEAGGRGRATLNDLIMVLLEREYMTNWQISRVVEGQRRGYFYNNWKILYLIGAGTFARVYRAVHTKTSDVKAIKVLRQRYGNDTDTRESFMREAKMVMKLRHPNIVPINEVDEDKGRIYMVMDFVEGQNLREYVRAHEKIPHLTALRIVRDVSAGLAYAMTHNISHRDMKLSNVLLSAKGQAKLVDFGLATVSDDREKGEKGGPRSIDYAGLERFTHVRRNDKRSDIYFVGCMLYHMLSGQPALIETRERMKRLSAGRFTDAVPITMHEPNLPHRIVILIHRLMELDAEKRIQTPELVVQETEAVIRSVESGDVKTYDKDLSDKEAEVYQALVTKQDEGIGKTVLLIESNIKVQDSLRDKLKNIGYRVLITNDPERGLSRFADLDPAEDSPADCVIFGCAGLGRQGVQVFEEFATGEFTKNVPAILITTEKVEKYVKSELMNDKRLQFTMPLKFKKVKRGLRELLNIVIDKNAPVAVSTVVSKSQSNDPGTDVDTDVELG